MKLKTTIKHNISLTAPELNALYLTVLNADADKIFANSNNQDFEESKKALADFESTCDAVFGLRPKAVAK